VKIKLDENIGMRGQEFLRAAGHDVVTVHDEALCRAADDAILLACLREQRVLVTLDHDFGNVLRFPPETSYGIVVLELPGRLTASGIVRGLSEFLAVHATHPIARELWIVEPGRIRVHQRDLEPWC
jgi:hypothetical protein